MTNKKTIQFDGAELRRQAEKKFSEEPNRIWPLEADADTLKFYHELQVHQIELEMQNAELLQNIDNLENALKQQYAEKSASKSLAEIEKSLCLAHKLLDVAAEEALLNAVSVPITQDSIVAARLLVEEAAAEARLLVELESRIAHKILVESVKKRRLNETQISEEHNLIKMAARLAQTKVDNAADLANRLIIVAEESNRIKTQFLANMSHELRTPMAGVIGMLELALLGNLEAEQRDFLDTAHSSARALVLILNDILDMTKMQMGRFSIEQEPFSVRECVEHALTIFIPAAKIKGLFFNFSVATNVPETLVGDKLRLGQVLTNLASNAVKFTKQGGVEINVVATNRTSGGKLEVTFTFTDTGVGILDDKRGILFQSFGQVDESHSRSYGGVGLGLAISREIVEGMGGTISFTSEEGKGSSFTCTIPFGEGEEQSVGFARGETVPTNGASRDEETKKVCILVAEDDYACSRVILSLLKKSNYETGYAENGQLAVEMWEKGHYDLILMDIQMPHMNGLEATAAIREKEHISGGHIPIVAMTAHGLQKDKEKCLNAGMDAYIIKPIDFASTLQVIRDTLNASGLQELAYDPVTMPRLSNLIIR